MPTYDYQCLTCTGVKEVRHLISELVKPTEETLKEITCNCSQNTGSVMVRVFISAPGIKTPTRNRYIDTDRKNRNKNHFTKEILPTLDKESRNHHLLKDK